MKHVRRLATAMLVLSSAVSGLSVAAAHPVETNPKKVIAAIGDCMAASTTEGLNIAVLEQRGWNEIQAVTDPNADGVPKETFLGRDRSSPFIRVVSHFYANNPDELSGMKACTVEGWLDSKSTIADLRKLFVKKYGGIKDPDFEDSFCFDGTELIWLTGDQLGNADFRIIVSKIGISGCPSS